MTIGQTASVAFRIVPESPQERGFLPPEDPLCSGKAHGIAPETVRFAPENFGAIAGTERAVPANPRAAPPDHSASHPGL
jgi:hypothetical protein